MRIKRVLIFTLIGSTLIFALATWWGLTRPVCFRYFPDGSEQVLYGDDCQPD